MKRPLLFPGVAALLALCGCGSETWQSPVGDSGFKAADLTSSDPYAPCTDKVRCCTAATMICVGDPDTAGNCKCTGLWDCSQNLTKCQQDIPAPPGGTAWNCTWAESSYVCTGNPAAKPPGGGGWNCNYSDKEMRWVCTNTPPNPTNRPDGAGVWQCKVQSEFSKLVCERGVKVDAGLPPPKKEDNCADGIDNDGDGLVDCKDPDCPPCPPPTCPPGKECCDGIDNDGDGMIDEGNVCGTIGDKEPCPPGAIQACDCYCGVHRRCKPDGIWGPCVVDNTCKLATITSQSQCGSGQYCDYGKCVSGYKGGQCVKHNDCPIGKICDLGSCIVDPYVPWKCPSF